MASVKIDISETKIEAKWEGENPIERRGPLLKDQQEPAKQGAGFIRVYRTQGSEVGIKQEDKNSALDGDDEQLNSILVNHYTHQDGSENRDHKHSFGEEISEDGILNWLDLTIYHPKFGGKYKDHPVMDLPWYYCQVMILLIQGVSNVLQLCTF